MTGSVSVIKVSEKFRNAYSIFKIHNGSIERKPLFRNLDACETDFIDGWFGKDSKQVNLTTRNNAEKIINQLSNLLTGNWIIIPSPDGSLSFKSENRDCVINILNNVVCYFIDNEFVSDDGDDLEFSVEVIKTILERWKK